MGTLLTHAFAGPLLVLVGLWHLCGSISNYLRSPRDYSPKPFYTFSSSSKPKRIEPLLQLAFFTLAMAYELLILGRNNSSTIPYFGVLTMEEVSMLFLFWLVALVTLVHENTLWLHHLPSEGIFGLASLAFLIEYKVMGSRGQGLEGKCNSLLATSAAVCAVSSGIVALKPEKFLADLVLRAGLMLQGLWIFHSGLSLYVEKFIPEGCHRLLRMPSGVDGSTQCDIEESRIRAMALMDLAFVDHIIVVVIITLIAYVLLTKLLGQRRSSSGSNGYVYDPISSELDSTHVQMKPLPKQAQF